MVTQTRSGPFFRAVAAKSDPTNARASSRIAARRAPLASSPYRNSSSNWSTTRSSCGPSGTSASAISAKPNAEARSVESKRDCRASVNASSSTAAASAAANLCSGADPGLTMTYFHSPAGRSGTTPARTSEDLPEPDGSTTAVNWALRNFCASAALWHRKPTQGMDRPHCDCRQNLQLHGGRANRAGRRQARDRRLIARWSLRTGNAVRGERLPGEIPARGLRLPRHPRHRNHPRRRACAQPRASGSGAEHCPCDYFDHRCNGKNPSCRITDTAERPR
jgi:hypothetical protein